MRRAAALALLAAVASCAKPPPPAAPKPTPRPAVSDMRFRGVARLVVSHSPFCPRSGPRVYEVRNGAVTLSYQSEGRRRVPLTAQIQSDGSFAASDGEGRLQGRLANRTLEMTIISPYCEHFWTMHAVS